MTPPTYATLTASPAEVLARLPRIGRLMLINSTAGVTHERIGQLDAIRVSGDEAVTLGPDHDARIQLSAIARMDVDRSSVMGDKAYPRVTFRDGAGRAIFSAISFAGMEPFDAALEGLPFQALDEAVKSFDFAGGEAPAEDPALPVLEAAVAEPGAVTIAITQPGYAQKWQGVVEAIRPSRGFLNVMVPNFHFHLKAGSVTGWTESVTAEGRVLTALGAGGEPLGLTIRFPG